MRRPRRPFSEPSAFGIRRITNSLLTPGLIGTLVRASGDGRAEGKRESPSSQDGTSEPGGEGTASSRRREPLHTDPCSRRGLSTRSPTGFPCPRARCAGSTSTQSTSLGPDASRGLDKQALPATSSESHCVGHPHSRCRGDGGTQPAFPSNDGRRSVPQSLVLGTTCKDTLGKERNGMRHTQGLRTTDQRVQSGTACIL